MREKKLLSPEEAAKQFHFSRGTLANLRHEKRGPPYYRRGRKIFYDAYEIQLWITEHRIRTKDSKRTNK